MTDTPVSELSFEQMIAPMKAMSIRAELRLALLNQDTFWVPRAPWSEWIKKSVQGIAYYDIGTEPVGGKRGPMVESHVFVKPDWTVPGILRVDDMPVTYRLVCRDIMRSSMHNIVHGRSWSFMLSWHSDSNYPSDSIQDAMDADQEFWSDLAHDFHAQVKWFNDLPLIKKFNSLPSHYRTDL